MKSLLICLEILAMACLHMPRSLVGFEMGLVMHESPVVMFDVLNKPRKQVRSTNTIKHVLSIKVLKVFGLYNHKRSI